MDYWSISIDSDDAQPIDLTTKGIKLAVNVGVPKVKYNALSLIGAQGDLDLTEAYGGRFYESRPCTVFFITIPEYTELTGNQKVDYILSNFYGKRIRLYNVSKYYTLIGRLTEIEITNLEMSDNCKMTCAFIGEPLRYEPSERNVDNLKPIFAPPNKWSTLTSGQDYATSGGFSATSSQVSDVGGFLFSLSVSTSKYLILDFSNLKNCTVRVLCTGSTSGDTYEVHYSLPFIPKYDPIYVDVQAKSYSSAVSGSVFVREYYNENGSVEDYSGEPVPIKVIDSLSSVNSRMYLMVNNAGVVLSGENNGQAVEYPQLMMSKGINKILVAAVSPNFSLSSIGAGEKITLKWRGGKI